MVSPTLFPAMPIGQRITAGAGSRLSTPFPVARRIGGQALDGSVHLVDGDGASLCEAVTQDQLERLPVAWADVVAVGRCRGCEALGCSSVPNGHTPHRDEQVAQPVDGSPRTATFNSVTAPVDDRPLHLSASVVAARQLVDDARRARTQSSRRPTRRDRPGSTAPVTAESNEDLAPSPEMPRRHRPVGAHARPHVPRGEAVNRPGSPGRRSYGEPRDGNTTNGRGRDEGHEP